MENLKSIRLFVAVYEERSFTAAAKRENATQSGVSQSIGKLEHALKVPLFSRSKGRIAATQAGDTYYRSCTAILRAHAEADAAAAGFAKTISGEIRIGLIPITTRAILAPAIRRFTEQYTNVNIRITEGYSRMLTQQVRAGAFDFAIVPAPVGTISGLRVKPFLTTPETLVSSLSSARKPFAPVRLADEPRMKIVLPGDQNIRRQRLNGYFSANNIAFQSILELDAMMGTLDLVAQSEWSTILPGIMMAAELGHHRFIVNPLSQPTLSLDLVAIEPARSFLSPAAQAFYAILFEEAGRINLDSDQLLAQVQEAPEKRSRRH
jgi:LysR family nitrogen assimilation transcriptional regulator